MRVTKKSNKQQPPAGLIDLSLYLVTDRRLAGNRPLTEVVRKAVAGGVTIVQLREKRLFLPGNTWNWPWP